MASIPIQDIQVGTVIRDRYRLQSELGHGGLGITYKAQDLKEQRWVAIKVVSLKRLKNWKTLELLDREAKVLENLDCEAIPKYLDSFSIEGDRTAHFYLVQELAPGKPLYQWIESGWQPSEAEVISIAKDILRILEYLQSLTPPIIHRDIKPQNILRDRRGKIYLVDFGSVQDTYRHTVTGGSTVVGTFGYMAPEQFRGQANLATDLYGLGATLIYLLTGKDPSDLPEKKLRIDFRAEVQVSSFFGRWIDSMIAPAVENRLSSGAIAISTLMKEYPLPQQARALPSRVRIEQTEKLLRIEIAPPGLRSLNRIAVGSLIVTFIMALLLIVLNELPSIMVNPRYWILSWMAAATSLYTSIYYLMIAFRRSRLAFTPCQFQLWQGAWIVPYKKDWPNLFHSATAAKNVTFSSLAKIEQQEAYALRIGKYQIPIRECSISVKVSGTRFLLGHGLHPQEQRQILEIIILFLWESSMLRAVDIAEIVGYSRVRSLKQQLNLD